MANGQNQPNQQGQGRGQQQQQNVTISELEIADGPHRGSRMGTVRTVVQFGNRPFSGQVQLTMNDQHFAFTQTDIATGEAVWTFTLPDDNEHRLRAHVVNHPGKSTRHLRVRVPLASAQPAFKVPTFATAFDSEDRDGNATIFGYADIDGIPARGTPVKFTSRGTSVTRYIDADGYAEYAVRVNMGDPVFEVKVNIPKTDEPENANFIYERKNPWILRWGGRMLLASLVFLLVNLWAFGAGIQPVVRNEPNQALLDAERRYYREAKPAVTATPAERQEWTPILVGLTLPDLAWGANYWIFVVGSMMFFPGLVYYSPYFLRRVAKLAINRQEKSKAQIRGRLKQAATDEERRGLMQELRQAGMTTMVQQVINFIREVLAVSLFH